MDDKQKAKEEAWERDKALRAKSPDLDDQTIWFPDWTQGFDAGWDAHAAASAQPATEWVDVSERLPEADNVEFWWTRKESNTVEKRTFWKCNSEYYLKEFSAWMPFHKRPEPFTPKETTV